MKSSADVAFASPERPLGQGERASMRTAKRVSTRSNSDSIGSSLGHNAPSPEPKTEIKIAHTRHSTALTSTSKRSQPIDSMPTTTTTKVPASAKKPSTKSSSPAEKAASSKKTSQKSKGSIETDRSVPDWNALEERGQAFYRRNEVHLSADLEYAAYKIAVDVAFALSEEVDEFDGFSSSFRRGLQWAARRALNCVFESSRSIVVLPEALPGYTLLAFKKVQQAPTAPQGESAPSEPESLSTLDVVAQTQAAALMIERYMSAMSNARVMAIESNDVLLALFPTQDTRRNLQDMVLSMREDPLED